MEPQKPSKKTGAEPLCDLEVPMINSIVTSMAEQHRRLDDLAARLAFAATRLSSGIDASAAMSQTRELRDEIRRELWSHLQIESELVFAWAQAHHALVPELVETLREEQQQIGELVAEISPPDPETASGEQRERFARTMLALAGMLDSHVSRYDSEVLPTILRAVFSE